MSTRVTRIDVIRHGEPEGGDVFRGHTDHELTERGRRQFEHRLQRNPARYQRVISSPLQRCYYSASWLAGECALTHMTDQRWAEIHYGDWENRPVAEVMTDDAEIAQQLWQDPLNFCAPNGEPVTQLQQRVLAAWDDLLDKHTGESLLVVSHGGVMRVLAQHLLGLAPEAMSRLSIPYAGLLRFRIDEVSDGQRFVTLETLDGASLDHL